MKAREHAIPYSSRQRTACMNHSFNIDIAAEVGVEAAIIFENILYWVAKNTANQDNLRDGVAWVYNSRAAWGELFPYLGEKQIRNAIERLLAAGYIIRDTFSYGSVNRTYWYSLAERAKPYLPKGPNLGSGQKGQTKTVIENSINITPPIAPKGATDGFDEFWSAYPNKVGKPKAHGVWKKLTPDLAVVLAAVKRWKGSEQWMKDGGHYIPHPTTWLNREGWNDVLPGEKTAPSAADVEAFRKRTEEAERKNRERDQRLVEERRRSLGMTT